VTDVRLELIHAHAGHGNTSQEALQKMLGFRDTASLNRFVRQNMRRIRAGTVLELTKPSSRH
jgi:hypothetical protein